MTKFRFYIALTIIGLLSFFTLTGCGGGKAPEPTPAPTPAPTAAPTPAPTPAPAEEEEEEEEEEEYEEDYEEEEEVADDSVTEEYVALMNDYIEGFEVLMDELDVLTSRTEDLSTDEEVVAWCQEFIEMKEALGSAADSLADVMEHVPEEYQESHAKITVATAAVYDAMTAFESAVDASINGDEEAFTDGLNEFLGNIYGAGQLWGEAVEQ